MSGRRGSVAWASVPDSGDAAAAVMDIAEWSALQGAPREWDGVLSAMRDQLTRISVSALVRADPICRGILADLRPDGGAAAFEAAMSALSARVDALAGAKRAAAGPRPVAVPAAAGEASDAVPARRRLYRI